MKNRKKNNKTNQNRQGTINNFKQLSGKFNITINSAIKFYCTPIHKRYKKIILKQTY